jgi:predicted solute-binding protein
MELLSEDILKEYGFIENTDKSKSDIKIFSRDKIDIAIKDDGIYYTNMGFDYPLKDIAALRKLYKELRREELKAV